MNRYICKDFYDFEMVEAFGKWRTRMREVVHPDYHGYGLEFIDDLGFFTIKYRKNVPEHASGAWRYLMDRFGHFDDRIDSLYIYDSEEGGKFYLPRRFYYSNGSLARINGIVGWA
jgi:hypothetical protein